MEAPAETSDDETLEEGRVALHLLERQLKTTTSNSIQGGDDAISEGSSRQNGSRQSLMAERRLLDQQPRDARLLLRKGSPLGLTLEVNCILSSSLIEMVKELDDRGLLEGGGVVPSYYTSLRQKNRRQLELQDRSSRMRQRGNEDSIKFKVSSNILRMIRVLVQKGLNLEEYFRVSGYLSPGGGGDGGSGGSESGMMDKDLFLTILRKLDLPCTLKDLILFSNRYAISSLQIDYELFLNDIQRGLDGDDSLAGSTSATGGPPPTTPSGERGNDGNGASADLSRGNQLSHPTPRFHLVHDLKTMLLESKEILNKSYDEIYRMFSRWDNYGTGMVTITQFFRVLSQLHINFLDQDQDFLVDLLDNDGQGKVDFEGLLAYCFVSDVELNRIPSHVTATASATPPFHDQSDECLSASGGSIGNGTSSSRNTRRPHTASAFRGLTYTTADSYEKTHIDDAAAEPTAVNGATGGSDYYPMSSLNSPVSRRPLTASARVLNGEYKAKPKNNNNAADFYSDSSSRQVPTTLRNGQSRPQSARLFHDDSNFILEINSDNEAEDVFPVPDNHQSTQAKPILMPKIKGNHASQESQSLLISPVSHEKSHKTSSSLTTTLGQSSLEISATSLISPYPEYSQQHVLSSAAVSQSLPAVQSSILSQNQYQPLSTSSSIQRPQSAGGLGGGLHLTAAKSNLRSAISVYLRKSGLSIQQIFHLFDMKNVRFFGSTELIETSRQYFNLNLSPPVASSLITSIAVGTYDRISYSDFLVFITDPVYQELEEKLQIQIAEQLEQQGREYQYLLYSILSQELTPSSAPSTATQQQNSQSSSSGIVSSESFRQSFNKLGFQLSSDEIDRIITKYDTHGTGKCSVSRFMAMVQNNSHWKFALDTISYHEEAIEECQIVRQRMNSTSRHAVTYNYSQELVDMCEYLGIRILSEPELLWIVEEAVNAPLPDGWSIHSNQEGKTYFYNHKHNITRWDHPLDPYFRKLRDENRKRNETTQHDNTNTESISHTEHGSLHNEPLPKDHDNPGTDEEDVRDDMSDYYRVRSRKSSKIRGGPGGLNKTQVSASSSGLPIYPPQSLMGDRKYSSHLLPSSSSPVLGVHQTTRPLSAPEDHPRSSTNKSFSHDQSHGNSQSTLHNRSQQIAGAHYQQHSSNLLLPGGTYVDTGARSGVPKSSTLRTSAHVNPRSNVHSPSKRGAAGNTGVTYNINGKKEKARPSSTSRLRGQSAMNKGNKYLQDPNRSLSRMFDGGLIDDLDAVMKYPHPHPQNRNDGHGHGYQDQNPSETSLPVHGIKSSLDWSGNDPRRHSLQQQRSEKRTKDLDTTIWL